MVRTAAFIVAVSLAAGARDTSGSAVKKGAPSRPKPDAALIEAFGSAVGRWRCSGTMTMPKETGGGQLKTRGKMTIRREVGGFAYAGDYAMSANKAFPGMRARMLWTYDPVAKKFYGVSADDTGSAMRGESEGFKDGKMVWSEEGAMMGKSGKSTTTMIRSGKKAIDFQFEMGDVKGTDHCTRF